MNSEFKTKFNAYMIEIYGDLRLLSPGNIYEKMKEVKEETGYYSNSNFFLETPTATNPVLKIIFSDDSEATIKYAHSLASRLNDMGVQKIEIKYRELDIAEYFRKMAR